MTQSPRKQFRSLVQRLSDPWMDVQPAWLGDENGVVTTAVSGVYNARLINAKVVPVYNQARVPADWDLPVKIGRHKDTPNIWQIIEGRQAYTVPVAGGRIEYHHEQHEFGQPDTVWVDRKQLLRLTILVSDAANFVVTVIGGEFPTTTGGIGLIDNQLVDLSAYAGTFGSAYVSIETDDDGVLSTHAGTDFGAPAVGNESYVPAPTAGKQMIGYVLIYDGQEELLDEHIRVPMPLVTNPGNFSATDHNHDVVYLQEAVIPSDDDVSNPPTESQLIAAFGSPDLITGKKGYVLDDNGTQNNTYLALAIGGHWWLAPLARAVLATPSVTVDSTATLASATGQWFGRAAMKVLDEIVVLVYVESSHHAVNDGELHIKFSDDYGATWSAEDTYLDGAAVSGFPMNPSTLSAGEDAGEPWLYIAPNGNLILHMWRVDYGVTANGTYQSVSTDGGKTWSASAQVNFTGITDDAKVFATDDDFVLNGTIYAGARVYDDAVPTNVKSILIKSADNGTTWEYVSDISDWSNDTIEVALEYIGDNTILAMLRDLAPHDISYKRVSTDLGATWGTLTDVSGTLGILGRMRMYTRSHIKGADEWWKDSVLIIVGFKHMNPPSSQTRRNCLWISQDKGTTWSGPFFIDAEVEDAGYGDIIWNPLTNQFVVVNYQGTLAEADLKQYNLTIGGI